MVSFFGGKVDRWNKRVGFPTQVAVCHNQAKTSPVIVIAQKFRLLKFRRARIVTPSTVHSVHALGLNLFGARLSEEGHSFSSICKLPRDGAPVELYTGSTHTHNFLVEKNVGAKRIGKEENRESKENGRKDAIQNVCKGEMAPEGSGSSAVWRAGGEPPPPFLGGGMAACFEPIGIGPARLLLATEPPTLCGRSFTLEKPYMSCSTLSTLSRVCFQPPWRSLRRTFRLCCVWLETFWTADNSRESRAHSVCFLHSCVYVSLFFLSLARVCVSLSCVCFPKLKALLLPCCVWSSTTTILTE